MKLIVVTILSIVVLMSSLPQATTYWMWKVNQSTIAQTLCLKKEVKGNTCQGKCHLKIQMDTSEDDESHKIPTESKVNTMPFYCADFDNCIFNPINKISQNTTPHTYHGLIDRMISDRILHPPQMLS
jgi:hypothetical protein